MPGHDDTINAAMTHASAGRHEQAQALLRRPLQRAPAAADLNEAMGQVLMLAGQQEPALFYLDRAIAAGPGSPPLHNNRGYVLTVLSRYDEAGAAFRRAVELDRDYAPGYFGLCRTGLMRHDFDAALAAARDAMRLRPDLPEAYSNAHAPLLHSGRLDEAAAMLRQGIERLPDNVTLRAALVGVMNYMPGVPLSDALAEHVALGNLLSRQNPVDATPFAVTPEPERRLRVALVSPNLCTHSVASFVEPILAALDRRRFEVVCCATSPAVDAVTRRLRELADGWIEAWALDDAALCKRLRAARVDIAIDLAGWTAGHRLGAFARRAAPVQVTAIGYPNTTGVPTMDARLVDHRTDPPGRADELATERLVRLPGCFLCFQPPRENVEQKSLLDPPEPAPVGAGPPGGMTAGTMAPGVTFGSFNALPKLSEPTVAAWARILLARPGSRLALKAWNFEAEAARRVYLERFAAHGIGPERIDLRGRTPEAGDHLAAYRGIDVALDPFPYSGTTTTCEALWMGVPVVTLAGESHAGRVGASLLAAVGLDELVAPSIDEYVARAASLSENKERRASLHASLRTRLLNSPLCDAAAYARGLGDALRGLWLGWCEGKSARAK